MVVRPIVCRAFIGRTEELAFLAERRLDAAKSRGGLVLVTGDAGIGKSRLVAEFCGPLKKSRWRIGSGACLQHAQRPYGPLLDVLRGLDPSFVGLQPAATKRDQLDAIVDRFACAAAKTGVVAIVEDIHWADAATLELLAFLATRLEHRRALFIATLRSPDAPSDGNASAGLASVERAAHLGRIDLAPLAPPELRRLIDEALTGLALTAQTRRAVADTSEGNPFFAEELLKVAVERNAADVATRGALPSSIRATLLERWHLLAEDDRTVVAAAAVIGRTFDLSLLADVLKRSHQSLLPALARAREIQLVEERECDRFRFRHALTREAIYAGFLEAQVRPLHAAIAAVLERAAEDERRLEGLAYHWWAAGDGARAGRYSELAGDAAGRIHAHDDALTFYRRALEAVPSGGRERGLILEKMAGRYGSLNGSELAREHFEAAAAAYASAAADDDEARCRVRAAIIAYTRGDDAPTAPLDEMLARLGPDAYLARSRIHVGLAWLAASFWFPARAARHLALVDPRAITASPDIATRYHNAASWVAMTVGDEAAFRVEQAAWVASARVDSSAGSLAGAHYNGALCYSLFGLHEEAYAHIEQAFAVARAERNRHAELAINGIAAFCYLMGGDLGRARVVLAAIEPSAGTTAVSLAHAAAWGTLVGEHLGDRDLVATWFDGPGAALLSPPESDYGAGFAQILARRGRLAEAQSLLRRATPDCERQRGNVLTLLVAARYGARDDVSRVRAQLVAAAADAPNEILEMPALELFDAYVAQRDGLRDAAQQRARAAAGGFARLRFPLLEAAAHEVAGDTAAAVAIYRRCGAVGDIRRLAVVAAVDTGDAKFQPPRSAVLSAREREIATLVARGHSNVQIARNLAISHKTVEKHLGSVYAKLGFSSRAQLAAHIG